MLQRDEGGKPFDEIWSYPSIIGKLNFLEKSSRLDLAYSVHQCARFSSAPKASHAKAVNHIVRYLIGTKDKGLIMKPQDKSLEVYVDADFAGNWDINCTHDPSTAKSCTGYIITYASCPLIWASKLQTEYALSTTESEYYALSTALREAIPL